MVGKKWLWYQNDRPWYRRDTHLNLIQKLKEADMQKLCVILVNLPRAITEVEEFKAASFFTLLENCLDGELESTKYTGSNISLE